MTDRAVFICLLALAPATGLGAADSCDRTFEPAPGSYAFVEAPETAIPIPPSAVIGDIHFTRLPVFDESNPRENNVVYRFANRFHILTRERTVQRDLLFDEGDAWNARVIEESARLLRDRGHLYDADIRPVSVCGNKVDVEVITRDVWSFTPEISYDRSGGEDSFRAGIAESNLLGLGREISFIVDDDIDRRSSRFVYKDVNIGGSRIDLKLEYTDSDDGFQQFIRTGLPFFSLDSKQAWNLTYDKVKREEEQFFRGIEVSSVRHEIEEVRTAFGFSRGLVDGIAQRWTFGWIWRDEAFYPTTALPPPSPFPENRTLSYPMIRFQSIEDRYTTSFNLDEIHRTEDLHLGHSLTASLGFAATAFGSDDDRLVSRLSYSDTLLFNERNLLQHSLDVDGYYNFDDHQTEDALLRYTIRYFRNRTERRSFFASFNAVISHNLSPEKQIVLGGLAGARAFDNRFQAGDRRLLVTLEERKYTDLHILNLVRVGFAAFLDVGRAWTPGVDDGLDDALLGNVGVGIRLASSKADVGRIIHIDFAFPISNRDDPLVDSIQVAVNIKNSF